MKNKKEVIKPEDLQPSDLLSFYEHYLTWDAEYPDEEDPVSVKALEAFKAEVMRRLEGFSGMREALRFKFDFWANCWQAIDGNGDEIYADGDHPLRCHLQEDAIDLANSLDMIAEFVEDSNHETSNT